MMAVLARSTMGISARARLARSRIEVSYPHGSFLCCELAKRRYRVARHGRHIAGFALRQLVLADIYSDPVCRSPWHQRGRSATALGAKIQRCRTHLAVVLHRILDARTWTRYPSPETRDLAAGRILAGRASVSAKIARQRQTGRAGHQLAPHDARHQERARGFDAILRFLLLLAALRCAERGCSVLAAAGGTRGVLEAAYLVHRRQLKSASMRARLRHCAFARGAMSRQRRAAASDRGLCRHRSRCGVAVAARLAAKSPLRRDSVRRRRDRPRVRGDACAGWGPLPARRPFLRRSQNSARNLGVAEGWNAWGETAGRGGAAPPSGRRRIGSDRPAGHRRYGRRREIVLVWARARATRREAARWRPPNPPIRWGRGEFDGRCCAR